MREQLKLRPTQDINVIAILTTVPDKRAPTNIAFEILTSRMSANMYGKLRLACERHGTTITAEWLF